jgi:S1-C subfamily serine protease
MIREGVAARPWLGIVGLSLSSEISRYYNLPLEHGVLVTKVTDGSPAQHAGMIMGDIILKMDRVDVNRIEDLLGEIHRRKVGDEIRITVFRGGFQQYFDVTLSAMS